MALKLCYLLSKFQNASSRERNYLFLYCKWNTVKHSQIGRPSIVSQFPSHSIVSTAATFVKANRFSAHEQQRESIGKVEVSLREIRDHLISTVPGLRKHGISASSVACLMQPPRHGTRGSVRYKELVAPRAPLLFQVYKYPFMWKTVQQQARIPISMWRFIVKETLVKQCHVLPTLMAMSR